jgi:hypothetical protein
MVLEAVPIRIGVAVAAKIGEEDRLVSLIDAFDNINSSTAIFNIFNNNNPRSIYTTDGVTSAYVSG